VLKTPLNTNKQTKHLNIHKYGVLGGYELGNATHWCHYGLLLDVLIIIN